MLLREPWNTLIGDPRTPGPYFNEYGTQFYGGDLQGLIDKLDYLKAAGFDTIYTTPIFDGSSKDVYKRQATPGPSPCPRPARST